MRAWDYQNEKWSTSFSLRNFQKIWPTLPPGNNFRSMQMGPKGVCNVFRIRFHPGKFSLSIVIFQGTRPTNGFFYTNPTRCGVIKVIVSENRQENLGWCERLYEDKAGQLVLYARALGLSFSEAEDVVQETFAVLLELAEVPEKPEHYAFRALRNRALNYRRSLWRRFAREVESLRWFEKSEGETPEEFEAMRCLATLPPEQREVIVLKIWSEYTFEQIAELMEISPNTVAGRYRYGLEKLRNCLKGKSYERLELSRERLAEMDAAPGFA
jgi:RNA polymerase sigma-70 factor (ECF subfamily)